MAVQKKQPVFHFNVGIIAFLMILVYILGHLIILINREKLSVYEVVQSRIQDTIQETGLILRDETIIKADQSGYINYYVNELEQVSKNGLVYTCDETGEVKDYISTLMSQEETLSNRDYSEIEKELSQFQDDYTDSQFQKIYNLKYDLENKAMQLSDGIIAEHMDEIESKMGSDSFVKKYSKASGLVTYEEDGYENKTLKDLKESDFDLSSYTRKELKTSDQIEKGTSVYRLTKGIDWKIVVPVSREEYAKLKEKESVTVNIKKDELTVRCPISFEKRKDGYWAVLSMSNYLVRYAKDRFLKVEIEIKKQDGLKIPNSAIVNKEFYKIPQGYFTDTKTALRKTITMKKIDKKGKVTFEPTTVNIAKKEDGDEKEGKQGYYYILKEEIPENTVISYPESSATMVLKKTVELPGVFNINRGYGDFRCVEILMENNDYTIVKAGMANSISLFDRIALDGSQIELNEVIY